MAREIFSLRQTAEEAEAQARFTKMMEEHAEGLRAKMEASEARLLECTDGLTDDELRYLRREVALRVPHEPMNREDLQLWLNDTLSGVAWFMKTGRVHGL